MKMSPTHLALALTLCLTQHAYSSDIAKQTDEKPQTSTVPAVVTKDAEASATPTISKAEVRDVEKEKEKLPPLKQPVSERALMMMKGTLSY